MCAATASALKKKPPKLGEILLKHTSLQPQQLDEALALQKAEGGMLGEILVKKNMILPHEIMRALCIQIGVPFVEDLKATEIDPKLIADLPINYCKTKEALPVAIEQTDDGERLVVAVTDPFNEAVMDDSECSLIFLFDL
jgi:type IV pilus assembly protein PilB